MDTENQYGTLATQKGLLTLLKQFHSFCVQNNIVYSLAAGSLLGAIRHNGFIPWDDDLDVYVDRHNYNKIVQLLSKHQTLFIERNSIESLWVDRVRLIADNKREGHLPTLDLLVFDPIPANPFKRKFKLFCILCLQGMMKIKLNLKKGSLFYRIGSLVTYCLGFLFPYGFKKKLYNSISQIGNAKPSNSIANYNGPFETVRKSFPYNMLDKITLHIFEDTHAYIMEDWDAYLTAVFGDYMTPPNEADRRPKHGG